MPEHHAVTLNGHVLLVVEDEPLIALDLAEMLTASGANVVSAGKASDAIASTDRLDLSAAILDVKINGEDCSAVCHQLSEHGIPFLFYTGDTKASILVNWSDAAVIGKPATSKQILDAVAKLCDADPGEELPTTTRQVRDDESARTHHQASLPNAR
jgi:DNA-binding response OmpR family regulator